MTAATVVGRAIAPREFTPRSLAVVGAVLTGAALNAATIAPTALAVFMQPISDEMGWGRGEISLAVSACHMSVALSALALGRSIDKIGPRQILLPLKILSAAALVSFAFLERSILLFYAAFIVVGFSSPGAIPYSKMLSLWFQKRRGIALAALVTGVMLCNVIIPPISEGLLRAIGWRDAYAVFGAAILVMGFPVLYAFFREPAEATTQPGTLRKFVSANAVPEISAMTALRTRAFWVMAGAQIFASFAFMAMTTHAVGILTEHGVPRGAAVTGLSIVSFGSLAAQLMTGYLLDRFDTPKVILPFAVTALGGVLLLQFGHGTGLSLVGMALFGWAAAAKPA